MKRLTMNTAKNELGLRIKFDTEDNPFEDRVDELPEIDGDGIEAN